MEFTIYKKSDGYPVKIEEFVDVAEKHGLMSSDLGEFMLTENGTLVLSDKCGNYMPILKEGKFIIDICLEIQGTIVKILY